MFQVPGQRCPVHCRGSGTRAGSDSRGGMRFMNYFLYRKEFKKGWNHCPAIGKKKKERGKGRGKGSPQPRPYFPKSLTTTRARSVDSEFQKRFPKSVKKPGERHSSCPCNKIKRLLPTAESLPTACTRKSCSRAPLAFMNGWHSPHVVPGFRKSQPLT
jgi:hypothetical protein